MVNCRRATFEDDGQQEPTQASASANRLTPRRPAPADYSLMEVRRLDPSVTRLHEQLKTKV